MNIYISSNPQIISHILDFLAGTAPIKGAVQISNFMMRGEGLGHAIYDFIYSFII